MYGSVTERETNLPHGSGVRGGRGVNCEGVKCEDRVIV